MARIETWFLQDLKKAMKVQFMTGNVFSQDNMGNVVGIELYDGGVPYSGGGTVSGNVIRSDGGTVALTGSLIENRASVVLPAAAYAIPGTISIFIKLTAGGDTTTIGAIVATVYESSTDTIVDPGTIIPSIQTLINDIDTARNTIPANFTDSVNYLETAITTFILPFAPVMIHGRLDSNGAFIESADRWVTQDYIPTAQLITLENKTSGGKTYVDYYNLVNGEYVFQQYDTTNPGDTYTFSQSKGTHIRLYSTHDSSGRNVVINQYVEKLTRMEDAMLNSLAPIHPSRNGYPNFDTTDGTFTLIHGATIYGEGKAYTINEDISVTLNSQYSSHKIVYSIADGALLDVRYNAPLTDGQLLVALYSDPSRSPAITCPYTVDGVLYDIDYQAAVRNLLAPIHPSRYGAPNFNTANNTFTIVRGTTIYDGKDYYLADDDIVCELNDQYTSHKIIYNISAGTLTDIRYYAPVPEGSLLIALYSSAGKTAAMSCAYTIDHNLFDINVSDIYGMRNYNIKSVNHRGFNRDYPENTLIAFKQSKLHGFEWIETDVQFTSDGVAVILHDETINRTARNPDGTELSSDVYIDQIDYEDALEYDFGIWKGEEFAGTTIPTFEQCIALCRNIGLKVRIELKSETVTTARIPELIAIIRKYGMEENVEFASFAHGLIDYINTNYHSFAIAYIQSQYNSTLLNEVTAIMATRDDFTVALSVSSSGNTDENLALIQATGAKIDFYTIGASGGSTILSANPRATSFTTNYYNVGEYLYNYFMTN